MSRYLQIPGVKFVAGRTFQTEFGTHYAGDIVEEADQIPNLDVLVSANFLYPYSPDEQAYNWLPPHLYNDTQTYQDVLNKLNGDHEGMQQTDQYAGDLKPQVVKQAEVEAEMQDVIYEAIRVRGQNINRTQKEAIEKEHELAKRHAEISETEAPKKTPTEVLASEEKDRKAQAKPSEGAAAKKAQAKKASSPSK